MTDDFLVGDVESALCDFLESSPDISDLGARVAPSLVGRTEAGKPPWAVVSLAGGRYRYPVPFRPRVQFHVYAEKRGQALALARTIQSVLVGADAFSAFGVTICSADIQSDLITSPDLDTSEPGYVFTMGLTVMPGI